MDLHVALTDGPKRAQLERQLREIRALPEPEFAAEHQMRR